ncbi:MAG TPA: GntR family transcriptional regulator, partial [Acidimicrobiales bacterium]|nr:GntR family transcriptional regulator [Acidimicrobiales bacterium]
MPSLGERIVEHLIANGASLDDGELAEALGVHRPEITETCQQLEAQGLVVRNMAGGTPPVAAAAFSPAVSAPAAGTPPRRPGPAPAGEE